MSKDREKLDRLLELEGMDEMEMLEQGVTDGLCYGICYNDGCDATYQYEPDSTEGWCEECHQGTVKSALVLAGMI